MCSIIINFFKLLLIGFIFFPFSLFASVNSYGQVGYINTPSAFTLRESSVSLNLSRLDPDRKLNLTLSPFDRIDVSIFYASITGVEYQNFNQSYKDKGFNFKFNLFNSSTKRLSVGLNDLAGTGLYSSEYIVFSNIRGGLEYSIGLGWGKYNSGITFKNPFISIDERFSSRKDFNDLGGNIDIENYFSGEEATLFFGASYKINENFRFLIEHDPFSYDDFFETNNSNNYINAGIEFSTSKNNQFKISIEDGKKLNLQYSIIDNFTSFNSVKTNTTIRKITKLSDLQKQLEINRIGLEKIEAEGDKLKLTVKTNAYKNQYELNQTVRTLSQKLFAEKDEIIISSKTLGVEVTESSFPLKGLFNTKEEKNVDTDLKQTVYTVKENYPIVNNYLFPNLKLFLGSREGFIYQGLFLEDNLEINFTERFSLISNFKFSLFDNFDELYIPPKDTYPNQVRSDIKKYLNGMSDGPVIGRLQLNYFTGFEKKHFFQLYFGILEDMYGGFGIDYLFHPESSHISFGIDLMGVKKRDYDMAFNFQEYDNFLARGKVQYIHPKSKLKINFSAGEYLAGDEGYTLRIGRRFSNGVELSGFFTKTNVSTELFGEGSFDKGIEMIIPIDNFLRRKGSLGKITWRPLTKDPGSTLIKAVNLEEQITNFRVY